MSSARSLRVVALVFATLGAVVSLSACAQDDTIVAVNINSTDEVGNPTALVITITQQGEAPVVREIMPPTRTQDGGVSIQPAFFERVKLPDEWNRVPTDVKVEAKNAGGVYVTAQTRVTVRPGGAVAAFVDLGKKPEMMPDDGDDAGTADASSGS